MVREREEGGFGGCEVVVCCGAILDGEGRAGGMSLRNLDFAVGHKGNRYISDQCISGSSLFVRGIIRSAKKSSRRLAVERVKGVHLSIF